MFNRLLSPDSSPNTRASDAWISLRQLLSPWFWFSRGEQRHIDELHRYFEQAFSTPHVFSFSYGRTALEYVLKACGVGSGDQVIIQAFTCVVVPNSIRALGAEVIYADIDDTYNLSIESLIQHIDGNQNSKRIKAVVVQHTFGVAADIERIQAICKERGVILIEDCAHSLMSTYNGRLLGTFGDAAIFSFGRDKVISSVNGGVALVRSQETAKRIAEATRTLQKPSRIWIARQLLHPIIFEIGKGLFRIHGKLYAFWISLWKILCVLPPVLTSAEKKGHAPVGYTLVPELAYRALLQLTSIHRLNRHRARIVSIYERALGSGFGTQSIPFFASSALLRYTIHHPRMNEIQADLKRRGVYCGKWYDTIIGPCDTDLKAALYTAGSCLKAEQTTQNMANLPTHLGVSEEDAIYIAECIKKYE